MKKIAIIGGGIIGLTTTNYLDTNKFDITLFDDGTGQATKASAGIISPWLSKRRNKKWYQLAKDGAKFYQKLIEDFQLDETIYKKSGTLIIRPQKNLDDLFELAMERLIDAPEMGQVESLSPSQTKEQLPLLKEMPSLKLSGGGRLDGLKYLEKMSQLASSKGIQIVTEKVSIEEIDGKLYILTKDKREEFDYLILTVGPHLKDILSSLGYETDIRPQKGQLLSFNTNLKESNDWPVVVLDGEADLIPFSEGNILIGATHENDGGWDLTPTEDAYNFLTEYAKGFLDESKSDELLSSPSDFRVGTRAYTSDFAPFFAPLEDNEKIVAASGLGSSGLTTGPYMGYLIADYFNNGNWDTEKYQKPISNYIKKKNVD